jgi:hypothetical protein
MTIFPWKVKVEQDQIGPGSARVLTGASKIAKRLDAVLDHADMVFHATVSERFDRQPNVSRVVFNQQYLDRHDIQAMVAALSHCGTHAVALLLNALGLGLGRECEEERRTVARV